MNISWNSRAILSNLVLFGWLIECIYFWNRFVQNWLLLQQEGPIEFYWRNCCPGCSPFSFISNSFKLAGLQERLKISGKIEFGLGRIILFKVTRPWALKKFPIDLQWGKYCFRHNNFIFYWNLINLPDNWDKHKISDKLKFQPYCTTRLWGTCPWVIKKIIDIFRGMAPSVLVTASSNLQVSRRGTESQTSSNLGKVGSCPLESFAL